MRRKKKRIIIFVLSCFITFVFGTAISYYYFGVMKKNEITKNYEEKIKSMEIELGGSCYVLSKDVEAGESVKESDFRKINVPSTISNENLMKDLKKIKKASYARDLKENSIVYNDMFYNLEGIQNDLRYYETSAFLLPINIENGDYVDVRISFNSGLDYVVLAKKKIKNISRYDEAGFQKEVTTLNLSSEEILRLSSAIVDAYMNKGTYLYTTTYISPETQKEAEITYPSNIEVQDLMSQDPNVIQKAVVQLESNKRDQLTRTLDSSSDKPQETNRANLNSGNVKKLKDNSEEKKEAQTEKSNLTKNDEKAVD